MIKRYEIKRDHMADCFCEIDEGERGEYVRGEDYDALAARLAEAIALIDEVDTLAINNRTGCGTCGSIQNLTVPYLVAVLKREATAGSAPDALGWMPTVIDDLDNGGREKLAAKGLTLGSASVAPAHGGRPMTLREVMDAETDTEAVKFRHLVDDGKRCVHCGLIVITEGAK